MKTLYTTNVTAKGGRNGHVKSENGVLDLEVRMPKALGGSNDEIYQSRNAFRSRIFCLFRQRIESGYQ